MLIPRFTARIDLLAIAALWCVSLFIINPFGDFPLNDDWSYSLTVKHLIETGDFRPNRWTAMPLITQVLWGSLFCIPAGFSFEALRLSTLTLSLMGILGTYLLLRELHQMRRFAVIVALTIGFNPIYYALSNTFMTDIPFTVITIFASIFFVRNLKNGSNFDLLIGTTFIVAATLIRQFGITTAIAFTISFILKNRFTSRNIVRASIPSVLCIGALLVFQQWLTTTGRLPALYSIKSEKLLHALTDPEMFSSFVKNAYVALLYFGWFLLPIMTFALGSIWLYLKNKKKTCLTLLISALVFLGLTLILWQEGRLMPLSKNIINAAGIGPFTLYDTFILGLPSVPVIPSSLWLMVTAASLLGGTFLVIAMGISTISLLPKLWSRRMNDNQAVTTFLFLDATIYMIPLLIAGYFDRYLIPPLLFIAASIASLSAQSTTQSPRIGKWLIHLVASMLIGLFVVIAVCGTRDYLTWNRVRWVALNDLMESKRARPEDINGGFEFNGLYLYDLQHKKKIKRSLWWDMRDSFIIAFGPVPGYSVIKKYGYRQWMPPHDGFIVVLEKNLKNGAKVGGIEHTQDASAGARTLRR